MENISDMVLLGGKREDGGGSEREFKVNRNRNIIRDVRQFYCLGDQLDSEGGMKGTIQTRMAKG